MLTRRQKHCLIAAALIALFFIITRPVYISDEWEVFYLIFVVAPLGFYLVTAPERMQKNPPSGGRENINDQHR
jgi:hypothetical protein